MRIYIKMETTFFFWQAKTGCCSGVFSILSLASVQFSLLAEAVDLLSEDPVDWMLVFLPCFGIRLLSLFLLVLFLHRKAGKYISRLLIRVCFPLLLFILFTQWLFSLISDYEI